MAGFKHQKKSTSTPVDQCLTVKSRFRLQSVDVSNYYSLGYLQDYVNTYVNIPETEAMVNDQMAGYEEREINVILHASPI